MALPDNRIRFPSTKIDLSADVGVTGQDHDTYPAAGSQARADWMGLYLIGLLSSQSSFSEPTEKRDGTVWFDLNTLSMKIWRNSEWQQYAEAIDLEDSDGNIISLSDWYEDAAELLKGLSPEIVFSGSSTADAQSLITIPESLRDELTSDSRPLVYKNGSLIDPRNTRLEPSAIPTAVKLTDETIDNGDTFTVFIRRIPSSTFYTPNVTIP